MNETIQACDLREFAEAFRSDPANLVAMNAVSGNGVQASARRQSAVREDLPHFSVKLEQHGITGQKTSNYQWAFAGFNLLREKLIKKLELDQFAFSINYFLFYDKLEKINLYLEGVLEHIDTPLDSREMECLLSIPRSEAGEWETFVSIVKKYGVMPAEVQPETASTNQPRYVSPVIFERLLGFTRDLRDGYKAGRTVDELRGDKEQMLNTIYRMLAICYGEPVKTFDFRCVGKDKQVWSDKGITPVEFYQKYIGIDLDDYISLVSGVSGGEQPAKYEREYQYSGNVYEGRRIDSVSVSTETLKRVAIAQLQAGEPVWFACDIGERCWRERGIMDDRLFDYETLFNAQLDMSKKERFVYGQAHKNHAMLFKGVDLDENGAPLRWLAESGWGAEQGDNGMFLITDGWFDKYTYQIVAARKFVPQEILDVYDGGEAGVLRPWAVQL